MKKEPETPGSSRFHRWVIAPILKQLKRGITPEKLSWTISLGITLGIFPIMGSTSLLCLIVGWAFKLNNPFFTFSKPSPTRSNSPSSSSSSASASTSMAHRYSPSPSRK